jgi:hypothetical protein
MTFIIVSSPSRFISGTGNLDPSQTPVDAILPGRQALVAGDTHS